MFPRYNQLRKLAESLRTETGYKVMRRQGARLISGADSRQSFPAQIGTEIQMPGKGIYLSPNKEYVLSYYSGYHDREVLLTLEFSPEDIVWGHLRDVESEVGVSKARIVDILDLPGEEES